MQCVIIGVELNCLQMLGNTCVGFDAPYFYLSVHDRTIPASIH